jgi:hypothetical protein
VQRRATEGFLYKSRIPEPAKRKSTRKKPGFDPGFKKAKIVRQRTDVKSNPEIEWLERSIQFAKLHWIERKSPSMKRATRLSWTPEQTALLLSLVEKGVSALRASVVLKRPKLAVQYKARQLGRAFPDVRAVRTTRLMREAAEREAFDRHRN